MKRFNKLEKGHLISRVEAGSPAEQAGIRPGWELIRIDNRTFNDIIAFRILEADEHLSLLVKTEDGLLRRKRIAKQAGTSLGISFEQLTLDKLQLCPNRCLFCFIDQNPKGLRSSLYVKDDDYRLSFLYGNFVTLNRLREKELQRIISLQLSPLYVSIHTTNPALRSKMMGSKLAERGLSNLRKLVKSGIMIHGQLVLCPGINTGAELKRTIKDLNNLGPNILSVALVPVGLTGYGQDNNRLNPFKQEEARALIAETEPLQNHFLTTRGSRFIFLADEFYGLAAIPYPEAGTYEGYPQLENGVGLARQFLDELQQAGSMLPTGSGKKRLVTIVTGKSAKKLMDKLADEFKAISGLKIEVICAESHFFGGEVTVSGLLSGSDIKTALAGREKGDMVFIANSVLREAGDLFLDDLSLEELEKEVGTPVKAVAGPLELLNILSLITGE